MAGQLFENSNIKRAGSAHFMIRRSNSDGLSRQSLNRFLGACNHHALQTPSIRFSNGRNYVEVSCAFNLTDTLRALSRDIIALQNRGHVNTLTGRSLLGISPIAPEMQTCWWSAVCRAALNEGPEFLRGFHVGPFDHIPDWATVLSFAMIAGINLVGYSAPNGQSTTNQDLIRLFGSDGVDAGANFLEHMRANGQNAFDLQDIRESYNEEINKAARYLRDAIGQIRNVKDARYCQAELRRRSRQAMGLCYRATLYTARAMLANNDVMGAYIKARREETRRSNTMVGFAGVAILTNAAWACEITTAPWSLGAFWAWVTGAGWPTALTVTNPAGLAVSVIGVALLAITVHLRATKRAEAVKHQNLAILISRCCNVLNEATVFLGCLRYLDNNLDNDAARGYIVAVGDEDLVHDWDIFVAKEEAVRLERNQQPNPEPISVTTLDGRPTDRQYPSQRQVSRFLKRRLKGQRAKLQSHLATFRATGQIDSSTECSDDDTDINSDNETE